MSVHLQAIRPQAAPAAQRRSGDPVPDAGSAEAFASTLRDAVRPRVADDGESPPGDARRLLSRSIAAPVADGEAAPEGEVHSTGTLSEDPHTRGMYVPPDFYHGSSYSPVFDRQDENGNWVPTPRFEGQKIISQWRGSLPDDFDPNARVAHDPLNYNQSSNYWRQNEAGDWVLRDTAYGGIPLDDNGKPIFTPDPSKYPEYFVASPEPDEEV